MTSQMYSNRMTPFSLQEMAMEYCMAKIMVHKVRTNENATMK